ncbi:MAG TPA: hypothetical protein VMW56_07140 [Candidatus Margulisiibacteriota bacterium]|nr:hypothetical protein [Candidatus Margulisiibacteriota bacterium]
MTQTITSGNSPITVHQENAGLCVISGMRQSIQMGLVAAAREQPRAAGVPRAPHWR